MANRSRSRNFTEPTLLYDASQVGGNFLEGSPTSAYDIMSRYVFAPAPAHFETATVRGSTRSRPGCATGSKELMTDSLGCKSRYNGCDHVKRIPIMVGFNPASGSIPPWKKSSLWSKIGQPAGQVRGYAYPGLAESSWPQVSFPSIQWGDLVSTIGDEINGHMQASSNMLVNAAQWSQTVGMIKNPFGLLRRDWRPAVKKFSAGRLAKDGANVWLEYRYGWSNLYRDLIAVAKARKEVQDHLAYLRRTDGSWASVSQNQTDVRVPSSSLISSVGSSPNLCRWYLDSVKRTCRVSCDIYREKAYERIGEWELICQRLGLNDWIEAAWDAVPFSFVVDWFIDIAGVAKWHPMTADTKRIRQAGYSVKTEHIAHVRYDSGFSVLDNDNPTHYTSFTNSWTSPQQCIRKSYVRSAGFPSAFTPPATFSGLNLIHAADGLALVAQRIR